MTDKDGLLERNSGIALWRQIADVLRADLSHLSDDRGKLPAEPVLARHFQVNRLTLRAAVSSLVEEGVLKREQGRGTFVQKQKRLIYPISRHTRFSAGLAQQANERQVRLLAASREKASLKVMEKLGIDDTDDFSMERVETLSFADSVPVMLATHWFPANRFPGIGQKISKYKSITKALLDFGVSDYAREVTEIEAHLASREDAAHLRLSPGGVILKAEAINVDNELVRIQFTQSRMAADRITLRIESERQ